MHIGDVAFLNCLYLRHIFLEFFFFFLNSLISSLCQLRFLNHFSIGLLVLKQPLTQILYLSSFSFMDSILSARLLFLIHLPYNYNEGRTLLWSKTVLRQRENDWISYIIRWKILWAQGKCPFAQHSVPRRVSKTKQKLCKYLTNCGTFRNAFWFSFMPWTLSKLKTVYVLFTLFP